MLKTAALLKVTLLHWCFSSFVNCTNDKLRKTSPDIHVFALSSSSLFSPVGHCWIYRRWLKINPKVCDVIMYTNWNLKTEMFTILRIKEGFILKLDPLTEGIMWGKLSWKIYTENMHQKLVPDHYLILVNSLKYSYCIQEYLRKWILKNPQKLLFHFCFRTQSFFFGRKVLGTSYNSLFSLTIYVQRFFLFSDP